MAFSIRRVQSSWIGGLLGVLGISFLILLLFPHQISANKSVLIPPHQETDEKSLIIEIAFRHLIAEHGATFGLEFQFYVLCLDSSYVDPSSRFGIEHSGLPRDITDTMRRKLSNLPNPLMRYSDCTILSKLENSRGGIVDNDTRRRGIMYSVGEIIRWIDENTVQVCARYYYHGLAAGGWVLDVEKKEGIWVVTKMD